MRPDDPEEPEVFTISEIARAAGVTPSDARWTLELDRTPTFQRTFVPFEAAVSMVHRLRTGSPAAGGERPLFAPLRPGSIAGTGGGPYRPGSGITPPALDREVKPSYTEEARRRGVEGDVVMEVVVRADGSVGAMRVIQGLGAGLDGRAIEAVRQWRFSPARRYGTPVDVLVEIAVEFRLR